MHRDTIFISTVCIYSNIFVLAIQKVMSLEMVIVGHGPCLTGTVLGTENLVQ